MKIIGIKVFEGKDITLFDSGYPKKEAQKIRMGEGGECEAIIEHLRSIIAKSSLYPEGKFKCPKCYGTRSYLSSPSYDMGGTDGYSPCECRGGRLEDYRTIEIRPYTWKGAEGVLGITVSPKIFGDSTMYLQSKKVAGGANEIVSQADFNGLLEKLFGGENELFKIFSLLPREYNHLLVKVVLYYEGE